MQVRKKASSTGGTGDKNSGNERKSMDFLKDVLGEELFNHIVAKINEHNSNEANKDKQIKLENINSGNYVSKLKYENLVTQLNGKDTELKTANDLIEQLKKGTKGDEGLQTKITNYETQVTQLQEQLKETKMTSAIKVALLSEKAVDVDYLTYKLNEQLKEKGEHLELDENDHIKGWDNRLADLKTQFPKMFEATPGGSGGFKPIDTGRLPGGAGGAGAEPKSLAEALRQQYETK